MNQGILFNMMARYFRPYTPIPCSRDSFRGLRFGLVLVCALFLSNCAPRDESISRPDPDAVVFQAGERPVAVRELMLTFQETSDFSQVLEAAMLENADQSSLPAGMEIKRVQDVLGEMAQQIAFEAYLAELAREAGLDRTEEHLEYIENTVKEELYQKILLEDVLRGIAISERDLQRFYQENREALFLKEETNIYRVRGLYVFTQPPYRSRDEAIHRAQEAYNELQEGRSFESVATNYSDAPRHLRGRPTNLHPDQIADPEIQRQLSRLQSGDYSQVFEGRGGDRLYIFKLEEFFPPEYTPFEEALPAVRELIFNERRNQGVYFLSERLRRKHNCLINAGLLEIDEPDEIEAGLTLLSVPGVYDLTLGEFLEIAQANRLWTRKERENYLTVLSNKAIYLAEALSRGWNRDTVAPALSVWERRRLAEAYIQSLAQAHVFTEEEIREAYETNRENRMFQTAPKLSLEYLFFPIEHSFLMSNYQRIMNFQEGERRALRALDAVQSGIPFHELPSIFTNQDDAQAGRTGWVSTNEIRPSVMRILSRLEPGEIGKPEQVFDPNSERYGYELYHLRDMRPSRPLTYEEARQVVIQFGERGKFNEIRDRLRRGFFEENPPQANDETLVEAAEYLKTLASRPDWQIDITVYAEPL